MVYSKSAVEKKGNLKQFQFKKTKLSKTRQFTMNSYSQCDQVILCQYKQCINDVYLSYTWVSGEAFERQHGGWKVPSPGHQEMAWFQPDL